MATLNERIIGAVSIMPEKTFHDGDIPLDESARTMGRVIDKLCK